MQKKFAALRFIGGLYKVLAFIAAGLTVLAVLGFGLMGIGGSMMGELGSAGRMGGLIGGMLGGVAVLLYGSFISVTLFAASQFIELLLEVHERTSQLVAR